MNTWTIVAIIITVIVSSALFFFGLSYAEPRIRRMLKKNYLSRFETNLHHSPNTITFRVETVEGKSFKVEVGQTLVKNLCGDNKWSVIRARRIILMLCKSNNIVSVDDTLLASEIDRYLIERFKTL